MTTSSRRLRPLHEQADRLRDFADALELRAEGDRTAFDTTTVLQLIRTAVYVGDLLGALNGLHPVPNPTPSPVTALPGTRLRAVQGSESGLEGPLP